MNCGKCAYLMEDIYGQGYCAMQDLYTFVNCGDKACNDFTPKTDSDGISTTTM